MAISKLPRNVYHEFRKNKGEKFYFGKVVDEVFIEQKSTRQGDYRKTLQLSKDLMEEKRFAYAIMLKIAANQKRTITGARRQPFN